MSALGLRPPGAPPRGEPKKSPHKAGFERIINQGWKALEDMTRFSGLEEPRVDVRSRPGGPGQAAVSHIDVSNALLIKGMFMPKLAPAALLEAGLAGFSAAICAVSVARSQEPSS